MPTTNQYIRPETLNPSTRASSNYSPIVDFDSASYHNATLYTGLALVRRHR